jgi:hypothetical protein
MTVAQPTEESDATTLPDPELNPLLNPLLAAHMGRWAEVYFTNPPEKRGQAVAELLRELGSSSPPQPVPVPENQAQILDSPVPENPVLRKPVFQEPAFPRGDQHVPERLDDGSGKEQYDWTHDRASTRDSFDLAEETPLTCNSCGHNNWRGQRFCGMCGMPLGFSPEQAVEAAPSTVSWAEPRVPSEGRLSEPMAEFADSAAPFEHHPTPQSESWHMREQNLPNPGPLFQFQSELDSAPRSYRVYLGAVIAILLTVLLYMAWRGSAAFWSNVRTPAQIPRAVSTEQPVVPPQAQPTPVQNAVEKNAPPVTAPASTARSQNQTDTSAPTDAAPKPRPAPRIVAVTAPSSATPAAEQGGSEELATAEKFLDARPGAARDTQEAARWLWKAVAKQNVTATFLLSDLYLRGDGVAKNCDQGRLLLDAAARKGVTAAAERLRHLQAFGCQ